MVDETALATEAPVYGVDTAAALALEAADFVAFGEQKRGRMRKGNPSQYAARHYAFWKFCVDEECFIPGHVARRGWIVPGPSHLSRKGHLEVDDFQKSKHGVLLAQYGDYSTWFRDDSFAVVVSANWDPTMPFGQFTKLVTQPGGIREFPVSQIRAMRWHHVDLVKRLRPDACLQPDYPCPFECVDRDFPEHDQLQRHIQVMHSDKAQIVALGAELRKPMEAMVAMQEARGDDPNLAVIARALSALDRIASGTSAPATDASDPTSVSLPKRRRGILDIPPLDEE